MKLRFFALLLCILLAACSGGTASTSVPSNQVSSGGMQEIQLVPPSGEALALSVEIADEPSERETGLMLRTRLDPGTGMLFVFDRPQPLSFWMKNTLIPLDIVFFDADGRFVSAASMDPCATDPCASYPSGGEAMYALEVPLGFVAERGVAAGWELRMEN